MTFLLVAGGGRAARADVPPLLSQQAAYGHLCCLTSPHATCPSALSPRAERDCIVGTLCAFTCCSKCARLHWCSGTRLDHGIACPVCCDLHKAAHATVCLLPCHCLIRQQLSPCLAAQHAARARRELMVSETIAGEGMLASMFTCPRLPAGPRDRGSAAAASSQAGGLCMCTKQSSMQPGPHVAKHGMKWNMPRTEALVCAGQDSLLRLPQCHSRPEGSSPIVCAPSL